MSRRVPRGGRAPRPPAVRPSAGRSALLATNPYLADAGRRRAMFVLAVVASSAVEGVRLTAADLAGRESDG